MDEGRVEALGAKPLMADLAKVAAIKDKSEMARFMGRSHGAFGYSIFGGEPYADTADPTMNVLWMGQGGLGLPDRGYYLSPQFQTQHDARPAYTARPRTLLGNAPPDQAADTHPAFTTPIAKSNRPHPHRPTH